MKFGVIKKQGSNDRGVWVIGTLQLDNGIEINDIFSTNLKEELDATKTYTVKKFKISRFNDKYRLYLEF